MFRLRAGGSHCLGLHVPCFALLHAPREQREGTFLAQIRVLLGEGRHQHRGETEAGERQPRDGEHGADLEVVGVDEQEGADGGAEV